MTCIEISHRWLRRTLVLGLVLGPAVLSTLPAVGQEDAPPLPEDKIVVDIDAPDDEVFRIGIPNLIGQAEQHAANGGAILQNDFRLMPGFRVIGPASVRHDYASLGVGVDLGSASEMPVGAMLSQLIGLFLMSWFVGVTAVANALLTVILATAAFAVLAYSGGMFAKKSAYARGVEAGYLAVCLVVMIVAQGIF